MNLDRPNKDNVDLGDLLVTDFFDKQILLEVKEINENGILSNGSFPRHFLYEKAIILKKDGKYLVGEKVEKSVTPDLSINKLVTNEVNKQIVLDIVRIEDGYVYAEGNKLLKCSRIDEAVILKPNGTYLVGENVMIGQKP